MLSEETRSASDPRGKGKISLPRLGTAGSVPEPLLILVQYLPVGSEGVWRGPLTKQNNFIKYKGIIFSIQLL